MKKTLISGGAFALLSLAVIAVPVLAQSYVGNNLNTGSALFGSTTLNTFLGDIINLLVAVAGFIVLIFLILGGIKYVTSSGDSSKAEAARKQVIGALIGLVIVIASFILLKLVLNILGLGDAATTISIPCVGKTSGLVGTLGADGTCNQK